MNPAQPFEKPIISGLTMTGDLWPAEVAEPVVSDEWRRWVAENVILQKPLDGIVDAMVRSGFSRAVAAREVQIAQSHPYVRAAASAIVGIPPARLAKRDWVLEIYRRTARLDASTAAVPIVQRPSREEFLRNYYTANRPVLIEGAMDDWPAMTRWTMEYLKGRFGDKRVEVQAGRNSDPNYETNSHQHRREMTFGQYIDLVTTCGQSNDFYMTANNSGKNREALADAWNDIVLFPEYLRSDEPGNRGFFWFGPAGIFTPLHHDLTNNFMAQVVGRKRVRLIAPYELPSMYNHHHCYSQVKLDQVDDERFPLFRNVRVIELLLNPGQVLFLPVGWWHDVVGMDISITMTFTNFVFDNDFHSFYTTRSDI